MSFTVKVGSTGFDIVRLMIHRVVPVGGECITQVFAMRWCSRIAASDYRLMRA
jgi:hypothetical protein